MTLADLAALSRLHGNTDAQHTANATVAETTAVTTQPDAPLTQTERDDIETAFITALDSVPPDERKAVMRRLERAEERVKNTGGEATAAVAASRARAHAIASRFVLALASGLKPTAAAQSIGADLKRDWGQINAALLNDPKLMLLWHVARDSVRRRLVAKAAGVVEDSLDGAPVDKQAARLAGFVLDRGGFFQDSTSGRTAPTAAPQVVINLGREYQIPKGAASVFSAGQGVIQG